MKRNDPWLVSRRKDAQSRVISFFAVGSGSDGSVGRLVLVGRLGDRLEDSETGGNIVG